VCVCVCIYIPVSVLSVYAGLSLPSDTEKCVLHTVHTYPSPEVFLTQECVCVLLTLEKSLDFISVWSIFFRINVLKEGWDSDTKLSPHNLVCMWYVCGLYVCGM
jgi:hypothetical protein